MILIHTHIYDFNTDQLVLDSILFPKEDYSVSLLASIVVIL